MFLAEVKEAIFKRLGPEWEATFIYDCWMLNHKDAYDVYCVQTDEYKSKGPDHIYIIKSNDTVHGPHPCQVAVVFMPRNDVRRSEHFILRSMGTYTEVEGDLEMYTLEQAVDGILASCGHYI